MAQIRIPTMLRRLTGDAATVEIAGATLREVLEALEAQHPGIRAQLVDDDGRIHRFVNIYLNDEDVRYLGQLDTPVAPGDTISILPAVAGGRATA